VAETLDAEYYRRQALLCHLLAKASSDARPLFTRLYALAKAYDEKAVEAAAKELRNKLVA
jgi:hypothetical protein